MFKIVYLTRLSVRITRMTMPMTITIRPTTKAITKEMPIAQP